MLRISLKQNCNIKTNKQTDIQTIPFDIYVSLIDAVVTLTAGHGGLNIYRFAVNGKWEMWTPAIINKRSQRLYCEWYRKEGKWQDI